ncbi:MAG: exodeoxyribonuclease VII large subunit [Gammaproteobacteria bacterium]
MKFSRIEQGLYTVSELNRETRELLNRYFLTIRVEGEISNLSMPSSGHVYFTLKDSAAQIRCAMFRPLRLRSKTAVNKGALQNGKHVVVTAQVSLYEPRGDYQLIVEQFEEAGLGALQRAFLLLKERLAAEGLFDAAHKRAVPSLPGCIGVITSPTGAALRDILTVLKRRFAAVPVCIYPVAVQGQNAKLEIAAALQTANRRRECDVLIVARGGGSLEDLWAFNEEQVARAIRASAIPVITGIGHETDFTIADFVADLRAPTPSAAAEHAVPDGQALLRQFRHNEERLRQQARNRFDSYAQRLNGLHKRLRQQHPGRRLQNNAQRLDDFEIRLNHAMRYALQRDTARIDKIQAHLSRFHPQTQIRAYVLRRQFLSQRLYAAVEFQLRHVRERLTADAQALHAISPLATLQRGYAIVTVANSKAPLTSTAGLHVDTLLNTRLASGRIVSRVLSIDDN